MNPLRIIPTKRIRSTGRWILDTYHRIRASSVSVSDLRHRHWWLLNAVMGHTTSAGVDISPSSAREIAAYNACLRVVSADCAKLPLWAYRRLSDDKGKEKLTSHPVSRLIHDSFNPLTAAFTARETMTQWAMGYGNGCALIERTPGVQYPTALWLIHPSRIWLEQDRDDPRTYWYGWRKDDGSTTFLYPDEVLHVRGMGDALWGYSVADQAARSLGLTAAAEEQGSGFFKNGAWSSGFLSHPQTLSEKALVNLRQSVKERYEGVENAYRPMILEEGMTWTPATVPPETAQLLETRRFQVEEIARWFGVPPHKIGHLDRATFSNIEHQAIDYVNTALMPWLIRWEQEIKRKLFGPRGGSLFVEHTVTALLRGDQAARSAFYREMLNIGAITPNEIRSLESMNASDEPGMDKHWMQSAMSPLELLAEPPEPAPIPAAFTTGSEPPDVAEGDGEEEPPEEEATTSNAAAIRALFEQTAARVVKREASAVRPRARKYGENYAAFDAWALKFYDGHAAYLKEQTRHILCLCPRQPDDAAGSFQVWQDDALAAARERQRAGAEIDQAAATAELTDFLMRLGRVEDTDE